MKQRLTKQDRNKLRTPAYFIKRLKDNGFITWRIFQKYALSDPRKWTVLIDPGNTSVFVTCYENKNNHGEILFHIDDGGRIFPSNFYINTHSMEVLITHLITSGVNRSSEGDVFHKTHTKSDK